jgi:hypothetical protein
MVTTLRVEEASFLRPEATIKHKAIKHTQVITGSGVLKIVPMAIPIKNDIRKM